MKHDGPREHSPDPDRACWKPTPGKNIADLTEEKKLREELGLDSVDVVSVVSQIERQYRIRLTHQELEKLVTVRDVLDLLQTKLTISPESSAA